jgi:sec-independent protein translocase protein TatB
MLRTFGRMTAKMRGMANDFRKQFDEALKEAELDDVKKSVDSLRGLNPMTEVKKQLNPFEKAAADLRAGVDQAMKPKPAAAPKVESADAPATPAEPLKNGATEMPGVSGPEAMPAAPVFPAMTDASVTAASATASVGKPAASKKAGPQSRKTASPAPAKTATTKAKASTPKASQAGTDAPLGGKANGAAPAGAAKAKAATKPAKAKTAARTAPPAKPAAPKKTARAK